MNTNSKRLSLYIALVLIVTAAATALRTAACLADLDHTSGYFNDKSLISIADILIVVTVIGSLTYIFAASKISLRASFSTPATYIPTGMLGAATVFLGIKTLTYAISSLDGRYPILSAETLTSPMLILSIVTAILSLASVAYYFLNAYQTESKTEARAVFGACAIAFFAIYAMLIYFDTNLPLNSPGKIVNQMAYIFAAIFFLYEVRISLGREMWRLYAAFGLAAAAICAYSSIPAIIAYCADGVVIFGAHSGALTSIEEYILTFALFVFILSKLILNVRLEEDNENEYIKVMAEYAAKRQEEVDSSFERFQEIFASKQLSFFELYGGDDVGDENSEDSPEIPKEEKKEEASREVMLSDDVIYESIFGRMPEKDKEEKEVLPEKEEKDPEDLANELLCALEEAEKEINEENE